jgi:2-isopropylmalate synthase
VVRLKHSDGRELEQGATGDGPIDATFKAIEMATGVKPKLTKFEVRSVSEGEDAQGEAMVTVELNERTYRGSSLSTNIIESSARAFLDTINQITASQTSERGQGRRLTQTTATV